MKKIKKNNPKNKTQNKNCSLEIVLTKIFCKTNNLKIKMNSNCMLMSINTKTVKKKTIINRIQNININMTLMIRNKIRTKRLLRYFYEMIWSAKLSSKKLSMKSLKNKMTKDKENLRSSNRIIKF